MELDKLKNTQYEKDTVDIENLPTKGFIYKDGPWSMCVEDVISDVARGGSELMRWIPTRGVVTRNEHVAHLSWIAPEGFSGSTSYIDYLAALDEIGDCDFGPSTDWNACEYTHSSYRVSFQSKVITRRDMGELECERSPIYRLRGPNAGYPIDNDADWALAQVAYNLENHLDWNLIFGDPTAGQQMYDGLDVIIDTGWVADHAVGNGSCDFTDPIILNGTALATPQAVLKQIKGIVRKIRQRAADRNANIGASDMAIVMPRSHWNYLADSIAWGAMVTDQNISNIVMNNNVDAWFRERSRITSGGLGNGFIEVDGSPVPVILDNIMGANGDDGSDAVVTGDIYILTRSFGGMNILEHQFLDWNRLRVPAGVNLDEQIMMNGLLRTGWKIVNSTCFQYFIEMEARIISRFQPLQAKITDVTVPTILDNENEAPSFAAQDFYAFNGGRGGQGVAYLTGLGAA